LERYISSKALIGELSSDYGINTTIYANNFIEWIAQAIGAIGHSTGHSIAYELVEVVDYKIGIPEDLVYLNYVFYKGRLIEHLKKKEKRGSVIQDSNFYDLQKDLMQRVSAIKESPKFVLNFDEAKEQLISDILEVSKLTDNLNAQISINTFEDLWWEENETCIKTNIEDGYVTLMYKKLKVSDEGYPVVIDTFKYKEAVKLFLLKRAMLRGYQHPVLNIRDVDTMLTEAIKKARNETKKLTNDQADNFRRNWTNLTFSID
jgi:hypothetical protein